MASLSIVNGFVVDGSGRPGFPADVRIEGDRVAEIVPRPASRRSAPGSRFPDSGVVDAAGAWVTPGFVDAHAHSDAYLVLEPDAPSKLSQGVTTEINGQCGGSVAPRHGEARLSGDWAALLGERLTWRSLAEYRAVLEQARPSVNTVQFVGHNTLRSSVIGYAARRATPETQKQMEELLARELDAGGWGLTTGLIYQPGKYSDSAEVTGLARVAAAHGGFYATHMRSEGDAILEAIDEVLALVRATGIRAEISHLKTSGKRNWGKIDAVLEKIDAAVRAGELLGSDRYPYCAAGTDLDVVFPDWAGEGAAPAEMARLADPATRAKIAAEIDASGRDWELVRVGGTWSDATRRYSGRSIAEILRAEKGAGAGELVCRILEADGCKTGGFFFGMSEDNLKKIYAMDWIVPGSDASLRAPWGPLGADHPHPRAYGTMPEFFRRLTRELGVAPEKAVARMTSVPARRFGIRGRGVLERGAFADVAVWRPEAFASTATYDKPHAFAAGVDCVVVNGAVAYRGGAAQPFTHAGTGRFLER
ncbi:MAG: amidohydrolase family protein [Kiritimatiellae bacterium]|nr:amidohydrolase family protein [Kiritimatiellia bacterium]